MENQTVTNFNSYVFDLGGLLEELRKLLEFLKSIKDDKLAKKSGLYQAMEETAAAVVEALEGVEQNGDVLEQHTEEIQEVKDAIEKLKNGFDFTDFSSTQALLNNVLNKINNINDIVKNKDFEKVNYDNVTQFIKDEKLKDKLTGVYNSADGRNAYMSVSVDGKDKFYQLVFGDSDTPDNEKIEYKPLKEKDVPTNLKKIENTNLDNMELIQEAIKNAITEQSNEYMEYKDSGAILEAIKTGNMKIDSATHTQLYATAKTEKDKKTGENVNKVADIRIKDETTDKMLIFVIDEENNQLIISAITGTDITNENIQAEPIAKLTKEGKLTPQNNFEEYKDIFENVHSRAILNFATNKTFKDITKNINKNQPEQEQTEVKTEKQPQKAKVQKEEKDRD